MKTIIEPFRIKSVEPIRMTSRDERSACLRRAAYNLFQLAADDVIIDLLTDSGTGAMSSEQWAGIMRGDESYAGARSYYRFLEVLERLTGMRNVLPTHQGRASERILVETLIGPGDAGRGRIVPNNAHFDTTRANIEHGGAEAVDLLTDEGRAVEIVAPFKGDLDLERLDALLAARGDDVPFVMMTVTCNSSGGQPVSLANLRAVRERCDASGIPLILDACRFGENAWFIKCREDGQSERAIRDIVREMFDLADGATHFAATDNRPLRSGKGRPYEGGLRVPFIMHWPVRIAAGRVETTPVNSIDVLPTVLDVAGVNPPDGLEIDGQSLWRLLDDPSASSRETMFWHYPHYWWGGRLTPYSVIRHRDLKLIRWYESGDVEFYDLAADPGEEADLAASRPDDVAQLTGLLDEWLRRTGARLPRPNPAYGPGEQ